MNGSGIAPGPTRSQVLADIGTPSMPNLDNPDEMGAFCRHVLARIDEKF